MTASPKRFRMRAQPSRQQLNREFDARRGSASKRGYGHRWSKAAKTHLARHPLCRGCEAEGVVAAADLVDHVEPHRGDQNKFWASSMWQSSCRWHHDVVKQRLELMWSRGEIGLADLWLDSDVALKLARKLRL